VNQFNLLKNLTNDNRVGRSSRQNVRPITRASA